MDLFDRIKGVRVVKSPEFLQYLAESRGLENDLLGEVLRSRHRAWQVAAVAAAATFLAFLILIVQIRESGKPLPPFILRVDNATGQTDVVSVMKESQDSYGDVVDKFWLVEYIRHRESYDFETIQTDYNAVGLLSEDQVSHDYQKIFDGKTGRDKVLADKARIIVKMESPPVLNPETGTATTRFTTVLRWHGNRPDEIKHWVATIAYRYVNAPMREQDRLINPLGFQVTSYRVDPDLVSEN